MLLYQLDSELKNIKILLYQANSINMSIFINDRIKKLCNVTQESVLEISNTKALKEAIQRSVIVPFGADRWVFFVDIDKVSYKEVLKAQDMNKTALYVLMTNRYRVFKAVKRSARDIDCFSDMYVNYLRKKDFTYVYDIVIPKDKKLKPDLYEFVVRNYLSDVDALFILFRAINSEEEIKAKSDIIEICGLGKNSVEKFLFSVLGYTTNSAKGLQRGISNRFKLGMELVDTLGCLEFHKRVLKFAKTLCDIKMICISGRAYKQVLKVPKGFNDTDILKCNRYMSKIAEIPLPKILQVRLLLERNTWYSVLDFERFLLDYYRIVVGETAKKRVELKK